VYARVPTTYDIQSARHFGTEGVTDILSVDRLHYSGPQELAAGLLCVEGLFAEDGACVTPNSAPKRSRKTKMGHEPPVTEPSDGGDERPFKREHHQAIGAQ
jgi:hypothetical protein